MTFLSLHRFWLHTWHLWHQTKDIVHSLLKRKTSKNPNEITCAVCCIAKWEDDYIDEFVKHHLELGFDKIIIYDNNDNLSLCKRYKGSDKVIAIPYNTIKRPQLKAYRNCMERFRYEYDWIALIDVDEFIFVDTPNIKDFLRDFTGYTAVVINWICLGAGGQLYKEDKPVMERFIVQGQGEIEEFNSHYKSIVNVDSFFKNRCNFASPHRIEVNRRSRRQYGTVDDCKNLVTNIQIENPLYIRSSIKHYWSKSWEEYKTKVFRGRANSKNYRRFDEFFCINPDMKDNPVILKEIEELKVV
jgi:hypothetical protein